MTDDFNGDNAQLVSCIESLISLDADGALVPHGLGGHARGLLAAAASRLALSTNAGEAAPVANAAGEAFNNMFHKCRAEVSMDWWQRIWGMAVRWAWENPQSDAQPTLRSALNAMLTQFGMDEDEWNKPTFDQARRALVHPPAAVHGQSARTEHSPTCPHFCAACATPPAAIPAAPSEARKQRFRWTDGTRTLKQDVLSAVHTYADSKPENDPSDPESWESWFKAAFDLCGDRIGDIFDEHERRAALAQPAPVQQEAALEGCTPADAQVLRAAKPRFAETEQRLREALRFYAAQHHFGLSDPDAWDTVSGEGTNFWCDDAGTATVEDGWVAAAALRGEAADWGDDGPPPVCAGEPEDAIAALTPPAVAAPAVPPECMHAKPCLVKCPITGLPYFMTIEHPELGMVETFGGPFDSFTVPALEGEPTEPWHEREMRCERYDHDAGGWVEGGHPVSLRIIHEDTLFALQEQEDAPSEAVPYGWQLVPVEPTDAMLDAAARASMQHLIDCINDPDPKRQADVGSEAMVRKTHASRYRTMIAAAPSATPAQAGETGEAS